MKQSFQTALILVFILMMGATINADDLKVCLIDPDLIIDESPDIVPPALPKGTDDTYSGTVRVYLVEPQARWTDSRGFFYRNALIDFPIIDNVSLEDGDVSYFSAEWNAADATHLDLPMIFEANIMAIGVVFNATTVHKPARPPNDYWFYARYADAAAAAIPGVMGSNEVSGGFTHTVFVEESTATT